MERGRGREHGKPVNSVQARRDGLGAEQRADVVPRQIGATIYSGRDGTRLRRQFPQRGPLPTIPIGMPPSEHPMSAMVNPRRAAGTGPVAPSITSRAPMVAHEAGATNLHRHEAADWGGRGHGQASTIGPRARCNCTVCADGSQQPVDPSGGISQPRGSSDAHRTRAPRTTRPDSRPVDRVSGVREGVHSGVDRQKQRPRPARPVRTGARMGRQFSSASDPAAPVSAVVRPVSISPSGLHSTHRPAARPEQTHCRTGEFSELDRLDVPQSRVRLFLDIMRVRAYRTDIRMMLPLIHDQDMKPNPRNLQALMTAGADSLPDPVNPILAVRLLGLRRPARDRHIAPPTAELNATETIYPGTDIRMAYTSSATAGNPQFASGQIR